MSTPVRHEHAGHPHEHDGHAHGEHEQDEHEHGHGEHEHGEHEHEHGEHEHGEHEHEHGAHPHEHAAAEVTPASNDNLILDIGADTGALIIHAAAYRDQAEVEISAADRLSARAHNIVRRRETVGGATYAAVFPALAAGDYVVWQDADTDTQAGTVTIHGGTVASFRLDL